MSRDLAAPSVQASLTYAVLQPAADETGEQVSELTLCNLHVSISDVTNNQLDPSSLTAKRLFSRVPVEPVDQLAVFTIAR